MFEGGGGGGGGGGAGGWVGGEKERHGRAKRNREIIWYILYISLSFSSHLKKFQNFKLKKNITSMMNIH